MSERYYKELARILAKNDIETAPPERNTQSMKYFF